MAADMIALIALTYVAALLIICILLRQRDRYWKKFVLARCALLTIGHTSKGYPNGSREGLLAYSYLNELGYSDNEILIMYLGDF